MGGQSSKVSKEKKHEVGEPPPFGERWKSSRRKASQKRTVFRTMSNQNPQPKNPREEDPRLTHSVNESKLSCSQLTFNDFKLVLRPRNSELRETPFNIPYTSTNQVKPSEEVCHVCGVYTGSETFPCRICSRVYHTGCLRKIDLVGLNSDDVNVREITAKEDDWSCPKCDNLSNLLTVEEIRGLTETFERYGIKRENNVTHANYLRYKRCQHKDMFDSDMSHQEMKEEMQQFHHIDYKKMGAISWKEFMDNESIRVLQKRSRNNLVLLLTEKEISEMRNIFKMFGNNNSGEISELDAQQAFTNWCMLKRQACSLSTIDSVQISSIQKRASVAQKTMSVNQKRMSLNIKRVFEVDKELEKPQKQISDSENQFPDDKRQIASGQKREPETSQKIAVREFPKTQAEDVLRIEENNGEVTKTIPATNFRTSESQQRASEAQRQKGMSETRSDGKPVSNNEMQKMVSWEDFLKKRVIYVLASRPNSRPTPVRVAEEPCCDSHYTGGNNEYCS